MVNYSDVNFIKHLLAISERFIGDERLSPLHISLYYALFHSWNLSKFQVPISISRHDIMRACKIGSANTYTKCLKELDQWEYIKYIPSHNPYKGSQIHMYNFNKTINNASDISGNKTSDKTGKETAAKTNVKAAIPSINTLNKTNKLNDNKEYEHTRKKNNSESDQVITDLFVKDDGSKKEKLRQKKKSAAVGSTTGKPTIKQIESYFAGKQWPGVEAEKFFNYYQSNGWLVGGKTPMRSWKACASNWMLNSEKFANGKTANKKTKSVTSSGVEKRRPGNLHATTGKDYSEPL
ncbi:MAG: transcriptional regulator [Bacteroidetes bacterium]|nr:transcriptional regulator [Bacteroidota bacterium]